MSAPDFLRERGRAIWDSYSADGLPAGNRAMVLELCRMADALDRLDAILLGRESEWIKVTEGLGEGDITLEVNAVLGERRQYALAFTTMLRELRMAGVKQTDAQPKEAATQGRSGLILTLVQNAS